MHTSAIFFQNIDDYIDPYVNNIAYQPNYCDEYTMNIEKKDLGKQVLRINKFASQVGPQHQEMYIKISFSIFYVRT